MLSEKYISYDEWRNVIDEKSRHKKIKNGKSEWCNKGEIHKAFEKLFDKFKESMLIVSYRDDGIPAIAELVSMLQRHKKSIAVKKLDYKYALSNGDSKESLIIAT